jgi:hypothetical protein
MSVVSIQGVSSCPLDPPALRNECCVSALTPNEVEFECGSGGLSAIVAYLGGVGWPPAGNRARP